MSQNNTISWISENDVPLKAGNLVKIKFLKTMKIKGENNHPNAGYPFRETIDQDVVLYGTVTSITDKNLVITNKANSNEMYYFDKEKLTNIKISIVQDQSTGKGHNKKSRKIYKKKTKNTKRKKSRRSRRFRKKKN